MQVIVGKMKAVFDQDKAAFVSIQGASDPGQTEFLLTPEEFPEYDTDQPRWLGSLLLKAEQDGHTEEINTGALGSCRTVREGEKEILIRYGAGSGCGAGTLGIQLEERYQIRETGILWDITVKNPSAKAVTVKRLGIPLLMNQFFRGNDYDKYEKCVMRHTCLTHHHSYVYWMKSSGNMPVLYLQALGDTPLVFFDHEEWGSLFGPRGDKGAYEGNTFLYPIYDGQNDFTEISGGEVSLEPGEEVSLHFFLGMAGSVEEMSRQIKANGGIAVKALPGMCVPRDEEILLLLDCVEEPKVRPLDPLDRCGSVKKLGDSYVASVRLGGYGIRKIIVGLGSTEMLLQFFGMESLTEMIDKQAAFIAEKQFETDKQDPCYHGLLMWDATAKRRVNASYNPYRENWWSGGSDEIGLVSGLFLSGKNVYRPDEGQVRILQAYVKDFLEARLTEGPGHRIHRMVPWYQMFEPWAGNGADDVWRAFNYVHVVNTYYNMYRIAQRYGYSFLDTPSYYIRKAYEYILAMFSYWMFPEGVGATEYGNMGELHIALHIPEALKQEGFEDEAALLEGIVRRKAAFFASKEYPYGSEMSYDSTAYEAVYAYGKAAGDARVMELAKNVTAANRGRQPVWCLYQTDLRQMGDGGWNVSYMTQLGAYPIYDWMFGQGHVTRDLLEAWYGSYLAGWSIYNSGGYWFGGEENRGASGWIVDGFCGRYTNLLTDRPVTEKRVVPLSGESGLGFYGALQIAAAAVADYPGIGRYGFGCAVRSEGKTETITPHDGLGVRVFHIPEGWSVEVNRDSIQQICRDRDNLKIRLRNLTGDSHRTAVTVRYGGKERVCRWDITPEETYVAEVDLAKVGP